MKVKLNYFKKTGKWYSEGEYETQLTPENGLYEVWDEVEEMFRKGKRPGLIDGAQEFHVLIRVPDHPHDHPTMIFAQDEYHLVYKTKDGIQLYAKKEINICQCDGSLHQYGLGCD